MVGYVVQQCRNILRATVSVKCGHPLKFNEIITRIIAQVESNYFCNIARDVARNNSNAGVDLWLAMLNHEASLSVTCEYRGFTVRSIAFFHR